MAINWQSYRFKADGVVHLFLFVLVLALWLPRLGGPIDLRWDGAVYFILGTSVAEGKGYRLLNEPGEIEAVQYPPLLPLIVAMHQWALGTKDPIVVGKWLRLFYFLLFLAYIHTIYLLLRNHLPVRYAFLGTLMCALNFQTLFVSSLCFPDILVGLMTTCFLLCDRKGDRGAGAYRILAALCVMASFALRTAGIALLAAWVGESLINRRFKEFAVRLALALIPIFSWFSYTHLIESSPEYSQPSYGYQRADYLFYNVSYARNLALKDPLNPEFGYASLNDIGDRVLHNLTVIPSSLVGAMSSKEKVWKEGWGKINKRIVFLPSVPWIADVFLFVLESLILVGVGLLIAQRHWMISLCIVCSLAIVCLVPWPYQISRYLVPLSPLVALSFFALLYALDEHSRKVLRGKGKAAGLALTGAIVALIVIEEMLTTFVTYVNLDHKVMYDRRDGSKVVYRLLSYHDAYRALDAGLDWLMTRAKHNDVVAGSMPHWTYLRTGLKTVMPPFESDPVKAEHLLESVPVTYLILDEGLGLDIKKYPVSVIQKFPDRWTRVYSDSIVTVTGETHEQGFEIYERVYPEIHATRAAKGMQHELGNF